MLNLTAILEKNPELKEQLAVAQFVHAAAAIEGPLVVDVAGQIELGDDVITERGAEVVARGRHGLNLLGEADREQ